MMITSALRLPSSHSSLQPILGSLIPECFKYNGVLCLKTSAIYECITEIFLRHNCCVTVLSSFQILSPLPPLTLFLSVLYAASKRSIFTLGQLMLKAQCVRFISI